MSSAPASPMERASVSSAQPTPPRPRPGMIQHAAVLGAGTMGVRIAAHLANAGIPVVLLDLAGDPAKGPAAIAEAALQSPHPRQAGRLLRSGHYPADPTRYVRCGPARYCPNPIG